jgi:hypothetical protein
MMEKTMELANVIAVMTRYDPARKSSRHLFTNDRFDTVVEALDALATDPHYQHVLRMIHATNTEAEIELFSVSPVSPQSSLVFREPVKTVPVKDLIAGG